MYSQIPCEPVAKHTLESTDLNDSNLSCYVEYRPISFSWAFSGVPLGEARHRRLLYFIIQWSSYRLMVCILYGWCPVSVSTQTINRQQTITCHNPQNYYRNFHRCAKLQFSLFFTCRIVAQCRLWPETAGWNCIGDKCPREWQMITKWFLVRDI